jgi:hypothetical protein
MHVLLSLNKAVIAYQLLLAVEDFEGGKEGSIGFF